MSESIERKRKFSECHDQVTISYSPDGEKCAHADNGIASQQMKTLRSRGPAVAQFADLPPDTLLLVLECLGYAHQQRLVRVCKWWVALMTKQLDQVYLDAESGLLQLHPDSQLREPFPSSTADQETIPTVTATLAPWKHNRQTVRQLTFNGQYTAEYCRVSGDVLKLAELRFPRILQVTLQVVMSLGSCWCGICTGSNFQDMRALLTLHFARLPSLSLALKDCVVKAFPAFYLAESSRQAVSAAKRLLGQRLDSYAPVPDLIWRRMDEVADYYRRSIWSQIAWSYPDEQLAWLARWAPCLNENQLVLESLSERLFSGDSVATCEEHGRFCDHLDVKFYRLMTGQARNVLAAYLLQLNPPGTGMPPPPVPFRLKKFHFREGKPPRFGWIT